jgi:NAD(P)-dependent dehydrogenase (short-subunit alcohol dehydrogenase family)
VSASSGRHAGQAFVITGAGSGIGRAIATRLAHEGAHVGLIARGLGALEETASLCRGAGVQAVVATADVTDQQAVDKAFADVTGTLGPLRGLVANAGVGGPNEAGEDDRFGLLVQTNLVGTYHCLRAAQAHLAPGPEPRHLIAISSCLGRFGVPGYTGYCASKAGILGLIKALALEVAADGIQANAVCPGWVDTEMAREGLDGMASAMGISHEQAHARAMGAVPMGRMNKPEEIAGLVSWLASADARGVIGQALDINGGSWMG